MDISITPQIALLVPLVMGVTSLSKIYISDYWAPLVSLALGIGGSFLVPQPALNATILAGVMIGTMAAGFYSGTKALVS